MRSVTDTDIRPIEAALEPTLLALAEAGLPALPSQLSLDCVVWSGVAAPDVKCVTIEADGSLHLEASPPTGSVFDVAPKDWQPGCFSAEVVGHGSIAIEQGASSLRSFTSGSSGSEIVARVKGWRWGAGGDTEDATLWVARLHFMTEKEPVTLRRGQGNMLLGIGGNLVRGWRFDTARGPAFLVCNRGVWYLAFSAEGNATKDTSFVQLVSGAIGFVLGEPFDIGLFQPFGNSGVLPGFRHLGLPQHRSTRTSLQPPALPFDCPPTWIARFVEAIVAFVGGHPEAPILKSIHLCFASLLGYTESKFLHAWIALESLARWGVEAGLITDDRPKRIADHRAWFQWVASRKDEIEAFAIPGMEQRLLSRVQSAELDRPTVVHGAFRGMGIEWTAAMEDAEKVRHGVAHEATMSQDTRDWSRDRSRIGLVKTMLVALIAKLVGYYGPIADQSKTCFSLADKSEPDWWYIVGPFRWIDYHAQEVEAIIATTQALLKDLKDQGSA